MPDSVKMIFKSLLGTILFMITTSLCIELFNINITGMQIRQVSKMAAKQAAELFTQETYKNDKGGAVELKNIVAKDGNVYIKGDFYSGKDSKEEIYKMLYTSESFEKWCTKSKGKTFKVDGTTYNIADTPGGSLLKSYSSLDALRLGLDDAKINSFFAKDSNKPGWDDEDDSSKVKKWTLYNKAYTFKNLMYTPINLGIPYLDAKVMNKMYRWNLAQLASNCDSDLIQTEAINDTYTTLYSDPDLNPNKYFINYKGFKIYASDAKIKEYQYYVFDLADKEQRNKYTKLTGNKVKTSSSGEGIKVNKITSSKAVLGSEDYQKEDNYVSVVSIGYEVPIEYIGITPLRQIFNYAWRREVKGFSGTGGSEITDNEGIHEQWSSEGEKLKSASTSKYMSEQSKNAELQDSIFTTGYLTYTIVN